MTVNNLWCLIPKARAKCFREPSKATVDRMPPASPADFAPISSVAAPGLWAVVLIIIVLSARACYTSPGHLTIPC
jgi:hypothetical protein